MRPTAQTIEPEGQRGITYLERAFWAEVGSLDIRPPCTWLSRLGGCPYAIQVYGAYAWWTSAGCPFIDRAAVDQALIDGKADLEAGLYGSRWSESPRRERAYMLAVADLIRAGGPATGAEVAKRLETNTRQLSSFRDRLINRGTLLVEGDGRALRFTVPGWPTTY